MVVPDETGWRVGAQLQWLWVCATPRTTVYAIQPGRGFDQAAALLGADFAGILVGDGWGPPIDDPLTILVDLLRERVPRIAAALFPT